MAEQKQVKVGMKFRSGYADSNPLWEVLQKDGAQSWICRIVDEPIKVGDKVVCVSEWAGVTKAFLSKEILGSVQWDKVLNDAVSDSDKYYATLKVGDTVHYHNGFGQFVRCVVVLDEDRRTGKPANMLKSVALVGKWHSSDLPKRRYNGDIDEGYQGKCIREGKVYQPNSSCIYESPQFGRRNEFPDPRKQKPIDLTIPPITDEEAEAARLWKLLERIRELSGMDAIVEKSLAALKMKETPLQQLKLINQAIKENVTF